MDETNKGQKGVCPCPMCSMYGGHRHIGLFILRWLLGIVILLIVFWMGLQIGEFRAYVDHGDYSMSTHHQMMNSGYGSRMPMMQTGNSGVPMIPAAGMAVPSTTPTPVK